MNTVRLIAVQAIYHVKHRNRTGHGLDPAKRGVMWVGARTPRQPRLHGPSTNTAS